MFSAQCPECKKVFHGWSLKYSQERICPYCGQPLVPGEEKKEITESGAVDANSTFINEAQNENP